MIEVDRLTKRYGSTVAVNDLSFSVAPGTLTGFLGPNGAGRSTTLRAILGLVRSNAGRTAVLGRPYRELDAPLERVGAVLETFDATPAGPAGTTSASSRSPCNSRSPVSTRSSRSSSVVGVLGWLRVERSDVT